MGKMNFFKEISINETILIFALTSLGYFICYGFELGYAKEIGYSIYFISIDIVSLVLLGGLFLLLSYSIVTINILLINGRVRYYLMAFVVLNCFILVLYYIIPRNNPLLNFFYIKIIFVFFNITLVGIFFVDKVGLNRMSLIIHIIAVPMILFVLALRLGQEYAKIDYTMMKNLNTIQYNNHKYGILRIYSGNILALKLDNDNETKEVLYIPKDQTHIITINRKDTN